MQQPTGTVATRAPAFEIPADYRFEVIRPEHIRGLGADYLVVSGPGGTRSVTIGRVTRIDTTRRGDVVLTFSCVTREGQRLRAVVTADCTFFIRY